MTAAFPERSGLAPLAHLLTILVLLAVSEVESLPPRRTSTFLVRSPPPPVGVPMRRTANMRDAKRPRTSDGDASTAATASASASSSPAAPDMATLGEEMSSRASSHTPLLESELDDAVTSLRNVFPPDSGIDWAELRELLGEVSHLSHRDWDRTGESATALRSVLLGDDAEVGGLTDSFRAAFRRVLDEGGWDGAALAGRERDPADKPWAVLVTGLNGIRKTTSVYQGWFEDALADALVSPPSESAPSESAPYEGGEEKKDGGDDGGAAGGERRRRRLPTGRNSFFRQLDHMIATLANVDFRRLYEMTASELGGDDDGAAAAARAHAPPADLIAKYSSYKAGIFSRYRTLSEMLGILLVREARALRSNVMIETSGRDAAMFEYANVNFPPDEYDKLALRFTINDVAQAERSVDARMAGEMRDGMSALSSGNVADVILANAGGPYGSEVLGGVRSDSDRVWRDYVLGGKVGDDWYRAVIEIEARQDGPWTARAVRPDGTGGKRFEFKRP